MEFREINIGEKESWRQAVALAPHQIFHLPEAVEAFHAYRNPDLRLIHAADGDSVLNLPVMVRSYQDAFDVATVYGYGGLTGAAIQPAALAALRAYLREQGFVCAYVSLSPFADLAEAVADETVFANAPTVYLDLSEGLGPVERAMSGMRRRHVRIRGNARIDREKSPENVESFIRQYRTTMSHKGAASFYEFPPESLRALVAMPETDLFLLKDGDEPRSSALFARTPFAADYVLGGSEENGRSFSSATLWAAVRAYAEEGVQLLNLGGGMSAGDSLETFKCSFGGQPRPFQCLKWVLDADAYQRLCASAGVPAVAGEGFFPAYHGKSKTPRDAKDSDAG